jgi:hypothetical protein
LRAEKLLAIRLGRLRPSKVVWVMGDFETPVKMLVSTNVYKWKIFFGEGEHYTYLRGSARPIVHCRFEISRTTKVLQKSHNFWSGSARLPEMANSRRATRSEAFLHKVGPL